MDISRRAFIPSEPNSIRSWMKSRSRETFASASFPPADCATRLLTRLSFPYHLKCLRLLSLLTKAVAAAWLAHIYLTQGLSLCQLHRVFGYATSVHSRTVTGRASGGDLAFYGFKQLSGHRVTAAESMRNLSAGSPSRQKKVATSSSS